MPVSPHLLRKLQETLGADAAEDLVTRLEGMDANRGDIGELRHEMQLGFARMDARFALIDARFEKLEQKLEQQIAQLGAQSVSQFAIVQSRMEALVETRLREQTRFFFLAWSVLLAFVVGLYAR